MTTSELERITKEKVERDEILEFIAETKLRFVEVKQLAQVKEEIGSYSILEGLVDEIWRVLLEISSKSPSKVQKMTMLSEVDQLDLICSYMVRLIS